ncbi:MAG: hypothetical protein PVF15_05970 [Candidatus Bathyarchaeota archaeon]
MVLLVIGSLVLLASNVIPGQLFWFTSLESRGYVKKIDVGVYWDRNCANPVSYIEWGGIEPGSVKNVSLFIRNEGTIASDLFLRAINWSPSDVSEFMMFSWDYKGQTLHPLNVVPITLTLQVLSSVMGIESFSFDIVIGATAYE